MSAINLLNFNVLMKDDQQYVFFTQKTLIETKYKCQEEENVETENSIKIQSKICQVLPTKRLITRP